MQQRINGAIVSNYLILQFGEKIIEKQSITHILFEYFLKYLHKKFCVFKAT